MKVAREEFERFWDEVLGSDWYDDQDSDDVDDDDDMVDLSGVCPRWQGAGYAEPKGLLAEKDIRGEWLACSFTALYKRWKRAQTTTILRASFEVPNEEAPDLIAKIKALGGKILK